MMTGYSQEGGGGGGGGRITDSNIFIGDKANNHSNVSPRWLPAGIQPKGKLSIRCCSRTVLLSGLLHDKPVG